MRLYDYGPSQNCFKVWLLAARLGMALEVVPVSIFKGGGHRRLAGNFYGAKCRKADACAVIAPLQSAAAHRKLGPSTVRGGNRCV